ncbi:MAG: hypothetical protein A3J66_00305 [Candidatus Magasanikbacteria bacterium RIFCSPHIGHO2_02_FULL_47_14]|uniref:DUF7847 domain-containing protein n=1 Tax=Candidatus Magasanikbacteria bacterium RIFCSPHIGHO2_02_FULL_47_14 TaxID=1798680 RepID=A0A1F6MA62_9BACT|nr:MAG: hypothetical protein A3J66_00305 [Candidatus Magasanikbacteria bacterium RIFCSPHIGHO2_02_FULL_47_14]
MLISVKDIISKSIELYKENSKLFFQYILALFIPVFVSMLIGAFFGQEAQLNALNGMIGIGLFIMFFLIYVISIWISLGFVRTIALRYEGKPGLEVKEALRWAAPLLWPAIFASILAGLAILGGFILLIIPGIIFSVWFSFVFYAVALDDKRGKDALKFSKYLVKGRWWSVLWRLIGPGIVFGLLFFIADMIFEFLKGILTSNMIDGTLPFIITGIIISLASSIIGLLLTPLSTAAPTILYSELKKTVGQPPVQQ